MSEDPGADRKLVENERSKLSATYVNGLAIAVFAVGGLAPLVSSIAPRPGVVPGAETGAALHAVPWGVAAITVFCWIASGALHWAARRHLGDLKA